MQMMFVNASKVSKSDDERRRRAAVLLQRFFKGRWKYSLRRVLRRRQTRVVLREILFYIIFLGAFTSSAVLEVQDDNIFYFGDNVKGQLTTQEFFEEDSHVVKTFEDIRTVEEWYQWAHGPLVNTLYTSGTWKGGDVNPFPGFVFGMHKIIGGVRIGQLRVDKTECAQATPFEYVVDGRMRCYGGRKGQFTLDTESHADFGSLEGRPFTFDGEGWGNNYLTIDELRSRSFSDRRLNTAIHFPAPAYPVILPNRGTQEALDTIHDLAKGNYIDEHTRAVMVDFTLVNPNMAYFLVLRITAETTHAGGLLPNYEGFTVRMFTYFDGLTWFKQFMEGIVTAFYVYYFVREVIRFRLHGLSHLAKTDTILHNLNIIIFFLVVIARVLSLTLTPPLDDIVADSSVFYDFGPAAAVRKVSVYLNALNAFLCWFKLIRYLAYAPAFALVTGTLGRSASNVVGFMVIFTITFYGFAAAHMMSFGALLFEYRNMTQAILSLITSLLGDFDLDELSRAQWFLGPFFFIVFVALAVFVVLNVLIAIISDAYTDTVQSLMMADDVKVGQEMVEYIWDTIYGLPVVGPKIQRWVTAAKKAKKVKLHKMTQSVTHGMAFVKREISKATRTASNLSGASGSRSDTEDATRAPSATHRSRGGSSADAKSIH